LVVGPRKSVWIFRPSKHNYIRDGARKGKKFVALKISNSLKNKHTYACPLRNVKEVEFLKNNGLKMVLSAFWLLLGFRFDGVGEGKNLIL
jgi:hypothetical protein